MTSKHRLQILLSLVGVLALLASVALAAGTMRTTEATWQDTVAGEAEFGASATTGQNYARALASYGTMTRWVSGVEDRGPSRAAVEPTGTNPRVRIEDPLKEVSSPFGRAVLPVSTAARTCARTIVTNPGCAPEPVQRATGYAVAEFHSLDIHALRILGRPTTRLAIYDAADPIRATASCSPGADGVATVSAGGAVGLGDRLLEERVNVPVPLEPGSSPLITREWGAYEYQAQIFNDRVVKKNHAISQVRLVIESTAWDRDGERWALNLILARAECGIAMKMPTEPPRPSTPTTPLRQMKTMQAEAPAALQPVTDLVEDEVADDAAALEDELGETAEPGADADADAEQDESELPSLTDVGEAGTPEPSATTGTTAPTTNASSPATSAPADQTTNTTEPSAPETSTTVPSTSTPATSAPATTEPSAPKSAEPTAPAETVDAPQQPQDVRVGRSFTVTGSDGAELGTAKVEDIVRTPGCGVELTLSITTADEAGPGRWASIGPDDFAEVRPGGTTRDARRISSDCEQAANSRTTALSPSNSYEIVIAFQLDDSASRAMLRPEGTGGWVFDLPALTLPTPPQPPVTTTATSVPETTAQTAEA